MDPITIAMLASTAASTIPMFMGGGEEKSRDITGDFKLPPFEKDPYYDKTQDYLYGLGTDVLGGDMPDFFKAIGQIQSPEFQRVKDITLRDTQKAINEDLIRRGVGRGTIGTQSVAEKVGDISSQLNYQDLVNAISGKKFLFSSGTDILSGVRSGALENQSQINRYNLGAAELSLREKQLMNEEEGGIDSLLQSIFKGGLSTLLTGLGTRDTSTNVRGSASGGTPGTSAYTMALEQGF